MKTRSIMGFSFIGNPDTDILTISLLAPPGSNKATVHVASNIKQDVFSHTSDLYFSKLDKHKDVHVEPISPQ